MARIQDNYQFKVETVKELRGAIPAFIGLCKRGKPWGQEYHGMKVWRIKDKKYQFAFCMRYSYPAWIDGYAEKQCS